MSKKVNTLNTSRNQVPACFKKIHFKKRDIVLNFGCGRYSNRVDDFLVDKVQTIVHYDPNLKNKDVDNVYVFNKLSNLMKKHKHFTKNCLCECCQCHRR